MQGGIQVDRRLEGKVAVVTGGSGGIGLATAELLHAKGANVAVLDLVQNEASLSGPEGASPESWLALSLDLTREDDVERAMAEVVATFGRLDILANVAAVREYGPITEATVESWQRIVEINLLAVSYCCKFAIPAMASSGGGSIVTVSSSNAMVGRGGMGQYDATKSALLALTRSMACDHAADGIRVNTVSPGPTLTPFHVRRRMERTGESFEQAEAAIRAQDSKGTVLGRQAEPIEIAYGILFLASDESSYVTGANIPVDGGLIGLRS